MTTRGKLYVRGTSRAAERSARSLSQEALRAERSGYVRCDAMKDGEQCRDTKGHKPPHWVWCSDHYLKWEE